MNEPTDIRDRAAWGYDIDVGDLTPVDVACILLKVQRRVNKGSEMVAALNAAHLKAKTDHGTAVSVAFLAATGPVEERKHKAVVASQELREAMDSAAALLSRAEMLREDLQGDMIKWQVINKTVMQAYNVAGVADR